MAILIEDNARWITFLRELLPPSIQLDYVVSLQEILQKNLGCYDVILLDLILPDSVDPLETNRPEIVYSYYYNIRARLYSDPRRYSGLWNSWILF